MSVQRSLPSLNADSSVVQSPTRTGPYLESYGIPLGASNWAFADEGSYFVATNATVGTGIDGHAEGLANHGVILLSLERRRQPVYSDAASWKVAPLAR